MTSKMEKAISTLQNRDAGWVNRRDAAEFLGKTSAKAAQVLREHSEDSDIDVQRTVNEALGWAAAGVEGVEATAVPRAHGLEELVRGLEKAGKRIVKTRGEGFTILVMLAEGQSQKVYAEPTKRRDGADLIRVYTRCGRPADNTLNWALKTNMSMAQCALALIEEDGKEEFVLINCFLASEVTPREIKSSVKEIAFYGNWVDRRLSGEIDS